MLLTSDLPGGIYECHPANQPTTKESICDGRAYKLRKFKSIWSARCFDEAPAMYSPGVVGGLQGMFWGVVSEYGLIVKRAKLMRLVTAHTDQSISQRVNNNLLRAIC